MKHFFSQLTHVGLDIKPDGVRLIQLSHHANEFHVEHALFLQFSDPVFDEGKIKFWNVLSAALAEVVKRAKLKDCKVVASITANLVKSQYLQLPRGMSDTEILAEIALHVQQDLPGLAETLCIDFTIVNENEEYHNVFFTIARKDYIHDYVRCIKTAGLNIKIVEVDTYALQRAVLLTLPWMGKQKDVTAILYIVNKSATFVVFNDAVLFQQHWHVKSAAELILQIKTAVEICCATHRDAKINLLYVCCASEDMQLFDSVGDFPVIRHDVFSHLKMKTDVSATYVKDSAEFIIACGSAMRKIPVW